MIRLGGGVVVTYVAGAACCRRARESTRMALQAAGGQMRAMQREIGAAMVEGRVAPSGLVVAERAIGAEAGCDVVRLGGRIVIIDVARTASRGCPRIAVRVALQAIHGGVRSVQREAGDVVVERGRPSRTCVVATGAIR